MRSSWHSAETAYYLMSRTPTSHICFNATVVAETLSHRGQIAVWNADGKSVMFMSKSLGKSCKAISNYLKDAAKYRKRFKGGAPQN
ncbi:hypothetical protein DYB30_013557 [Aphanomyces astaci]|uniref:Uncharacterized protein n=1 Tax=Aphanomyces astaci TaxID=112090 RepID=A0A397DZU5_APHAT|nr:hypothetical protein DYB36_012146 [Aphanomyces astaci]RHY72986.1 hypothetical protein DYB30_013557 [Aphanomyces astaci]